ncbi:MAG: hypothetical protein GY796_22550 [Chloroflexi bacterium]|nr:hypothetical protein [Chloroflexota bacterium]
MKKQTATAVIILTLLLLVACADGQTPESSPTPFDAAIADDTAVLPTIDPLQIAPPTNTPTPLPTQLPAGFEASLTITRTAVTVDREPTATAAPPCLYTYSLISSTTIPTGPLNPGSGFLQTWRIRNDGTCAWQPGSSWIFTGGEQMSGPDLLPLPNAAPGQTVDVQVTLYAPTTPGVFSGQWQPQMADGLRLQPPSPVAINVLTATPQPTAVPPTPTPTATPFITNWRGEYFANRNLEGSPVLVQDDPEINFNWGTASPGEELQNGNFSVRWTRTLVAPGGRYRVFARSEDGVRVWINGVQLFDEWHNGQNATYQSDFDLKAGEELNARVEYYHATGLANVHVWAELQSDYPDWRGSYIADPNLQGQPRLIRNDADINFDWGEGAPAAGMPSNNFSVIWIRTVNFNTGSYKFNATVDDGVRVYVDDALVIDEWRDGTVRTVSGIISLSGGDHDMTVTYYDRLAEAEIKVWWEPVNDIQ